MWLNYKIISLQGLELEGAINLDNIDEIYMHMANVIRFEKNDITVREFCFSFKKTRDSVFNEILEMLRKNQGYYKEENIMFEIIQ